MKKTKLLIVGLLAAIPIIGWSLAANAQTFKTGDNVTVASGETINGALFASGSTLDISGKVDGDIYCAGQTVTISAEVNGDIICAAQTIDIRGKVNGDIRLAAQTVTLTSEIENSASLLAQTVNIQSDAKLGRDVVVGGQTVTVNGSVGRDVVLGAEKTVVNGQVAGNIRGEVNKLSVGSQANIGGNVTYTSDNTLNRESGSVISGTITQEYPAQKNSNKDNGVGFAIYLIVAMLLASIVLALVMPGLFKKGSQAAISNWGKTLAIGIVVTVLLPILVIALTLTLVGIPLAILLVLSWLVVLFLSGPFAAFLVGRLILKNTTNNVVWMMLLGSLILLFLYVVPVVNLLVLMLALWFGVGMVLQALNLSRPNYQLNEANVAEAKVSRVSTKTKKTKK